jgi:hypothetical protein
MSPWFIMANDQPTTAIVSPGYNSNHALRLGVATTNFTEFSVQHPIIGLQCEGYYYRVSFAVNWDTYSGPPSSDLMGCRVFVQSSYCYGDVVGPSMVYATPGAGWKHYSYTCMAKRTADAVYVVDFDCFGNATYQVPAFNFELDSLNIKTLGKSAQ